MSRRALDLPRVAPKAYFQMVVTLVRLAKMLLVLMIAFLAMSFVIGLGAPETGAVEKVCLVALIAGCVLAAAKVSTSATKAQARLQRH